MIHVSLRFSHEAFDATSVIAIDHDLFTLAVRWRCDLLPGRRSLAVAMGSLDPNQVMVNPLRMWRLTHSVVPHTIGQSKVWPYSG